MRLRDRVRGDVRLRGLPARYGFAVVAVAAAFVLKLLLTSLTGTGATFILFFAAMLVTSLYAGVGPTILALAMSLPLAAASFTMPAGRQATHAYFRALLYVTNGGLIVYLAILTERRRRRMHETVELAPDAYLLADLDATVTDVNEAACQLLGYERDELVGKKIFDLVPPEDIPRLKAMKTELMVPHKVHKAEWALTRKGGALLPVEVSSNILPDDRWQAFVRDISERRAIADERERLLAQEQLARQQAESANALLRESEERIRLTIDEAPIGMALVALDGRYVRVNQMLCEITGYRAEELTRLSIHDITHPDDLDADRELRGRLARGEIPRYQGEKRYLRKGGTIVDVMLSASVLRGSDGAARYYITQAEDITQRKRAEAALKHAVAARDDVLGIVAHDLRNPLSTIMAQASVMERPEPEPERRDPTPRLVIMRSATRMNDLIQDLLDVAVVEAGELKVERARLSAADLAREVVETQRPLASSSGIEMRLEMGRDVRDVWGDRNRLLRVLDNLIGNALKFTKDGGHITVGIAPSAREVVFSVADTGPGMAPESVAHVFDRFWQAAGRASRLGAGLGLPIARGIVEAHGGRMWVESTVGHGSTFFFTIPVAPAETGPTMRTALPRQKGRTPRAARD
jgi:PAS domain S-box-containing protein